MVLSCEIREYLFDDWVNGVSRLFCGFVKCCPGSAYDLMQREGHNLADQIFASSVVVGEWRMLFH